LHPWRLYAIQQQMTTNSQLQPVPLLHQRDRLLRELRHLARSNLMRGSLSVVARKCGKPTCACATTDHRHPARYLSIKRDGQTQLAYISAEQEAEVRVALRRCRRVLRLLDELTQVNLQLLQQARPARRRKNRESQ
jgi:hypothetical protein